MPPMSEERRLVTVLFSDVAGSTGLGEQIDPEDLRALMGRYFTIAQDAVTTHGGTVEKFIGDAVMAVFGMPVAYGDDPERALLAALQLRDTVQADAVLGKRLPIRLGVNTGEVVASRGGTATDFLLTGDAVNTAARLQQDAEPWRIVVGERTVRAVGERFVFGPLVDLGLRGKSTVVGGAELVGQATARARRRLPLVGRDDDLAQLQLVARRAFRERRPYLVSVIAPPGTGKSRLLEEFIDRLPDLTPDASVALAQCLPYGQRLTYWPMRGLLLGLIGLPDDVSPDDLRSATHDWLERLGAPDPDRDAELLVTTIGAGEAEVTDRTTLYAAWRRAIELASAHRPLLLAVEDLHWSSDSLLDLVEAILAPRANVPLVMISLARPELLDRRPGWGGGRRDYVSLELAPLEPEALEALVGDLLEAPAPELVRAVVSRSDGNPFYAGEIVRSVLDRTGGSTHGDAIAAALAALPDTVQATVLARLDVLAATPRRVLQIGAVLGRTFRAGGLAAVEGGNADGFESALDDLVDRDLIRASGPDTYTFRHILIREVAYGTLPRAERARAHEAAAGWLESTAGSRIDEFAELVAYHYREAATLGSVLGGSAPPEIRSKAVIWLRHAADVAMAAAAQVEAGRHIEAAIPLAEADDLPELYETLANDLPASPASVDAYVEALRLARERGRSPNVQLRILAQGLVEAARWHGAVGHVYHQTTDAFVSLGRELMPQVTDDRARATYLIGKAFTVWARHDDIDEASRREATAEANEGAAIARRLDDPILLSEALDAIASVELAADDYRSSLASIEERLRLGDRLDFVERLDASAMWLWHQSVLGNVDRAVTRAGELLASLIPGEAPSFAVAIGGWLVAGLHILGRWDEAIPAFNRLNVVWTEINRPPAGYALNAFVCALEIARARQDLRIADMARDAISEIASGLGHGERGARMALFIQPNLEEISRQLIDQWAYFHGRIDHLDRALAVCTDRAYPIAPSTLEPMIEHLDNRGIVIVAAQARRALGLSRRDADALRDACAIFERHGAVPYLARARVELGRLTGDEALVDRGRAVLEDLGDVDQLARYAAAASSAG
jgi:class 3 adenylate cyclase